MAEKNLCRLDREHVQLLVVDIQEKLLPHIHEHERMVRQAALMVRASTELELPVTISEQYPEGLGATTPEILEAAGQATKMQKMTFSYCADEGCRKQLSKVLRPRVLLVGMETHVCVQQTALDLLDMQMQPIVLADAVSSRRVFDYDVALRRMAAAGVVVTTVESAIFELVHESGTEVFKRILPLVK